ncbi:iron chelate uptake ABC transporter family permease subunit, partial [Agrobacterium sp. S2]|nr:iron chelate uptake ABC transporter family permease subunit [Agrobacterium sp. S2]
MTMPGSGKAAAVLLAGRSNRVRMAWLGAVLALLGLLCGLSVAIGTREVSFADILGGVSGRVETVAEATVAVRLPRTVLALIAGAALGLAGAIMQGVTRNPLADPGILGVNMGASLAVVIGIVWFGIASAQAFIVTAIAGAGASAIFVY